MRIIKVIFLIVAAILVIILVSMLSVDLFRNQAHAHSNTCSIRPMIMAKGGGG